MGFPIPKDKVDLFKILILKDYYSHEDKEKKKKSTLEKLETESKELHDKLKKIDRKQEAKIISQANKNFNIHLHTNRLMKEDPDYLSELNDLINKKLHYFTNPVLYN